MALYMRKPDLPQIVEAEQAQAGSQSHPGQGLRPPRPGDWIVTDHSTGQVQVLTHEEFSSQYTVAPIPSHMLTPAPGQAQAPNPNPNVSSAPPVDQPVPSPTGAFEQFTLEQPATAMNEGVVDRPAPTTEVRPRLQEPEPIQTPTGLVQQPGDADKDFEQSTTPPVENPETPPLGEPETPA